MNGRHNSLNGNTNQRLWNNAWGLCKSVSAGSVYLAADWKAKMGWELNNRLLALSPVTAGQGDRSVPSKLWHCHLMSDWGLEWGKSRMDPPCNPRICFLVRSVSDFSSNLWNLQGVPRPTTIQKGLNQYRLRKWPPNLLTYKKWVPAY